MKRLPLTIAILLTLSVVSLAMRPATAAAQVFEPASGGNRSAAKAAPQPTATVIATNIVQVVADYQSKPAENRASVFYLVALVLLVLAFEPSLEALLRRRPARL